MRLRSTVPLVVSVLLLLAAYAVGCSRSADTSDAALHAAALPAAPASLVGDAACAECHADIAADYARTTHAASISPYDPRTAPEQYGPDGVGPEIVHPSGRRYEAFVQGDTLFQREYRIGRDGRRTAMRVVAAHHVIGSGNATRSYLAAERAPGGDAYLTQMPLTWYVDAEKWDLSPGYDFSDSRFSRAINIECSSCHVSGAEVVPHTQNRYTNVGVALGCESCHGAGSAHAEAHRDGRAPSPSSDLVNPANLSPEAELAVCQQCHLEGLSVLMAEETATSYRPGEPLGAHRAVFVPEEKLQHPEDFGLASHAYRLMQSACFEETLAKGGAMTCTTCHDPHRPSAEFDLSASCQACHGDGHEAMCSRPETHGASGDAAMEIAMTGDCVACHMTVGDVENIPHVTFTDHWIRRDPPAVTTDHEAKVAAAAARTTPHELVEVLEQQDALWGKPAPERTPASEARAALEAGMAYFTLYDSEHRLPAYLPRAIAGIRRGLAAGVHRPDAYLTLGRALAESDSLRAAADALRAGSERFPDHASLAYWLGHTLQRLGDAPGALAALDRSVAAQPLFQEAHEKRGEVLAALGQSAESIAAFQAAVDLAPGRSPVAWNNLGFELLKTQRGTDAQDAFRRALALDGDFVTARVNLASALLLENRPADAIPELEQVLGVNPEEVSALGNLGVAYARTGRLDEARGAFRQLLEIDPRDQRARAYLAELEQTPAAGPLRR